MEGERGAMQLEVSRQRATDVPSARRNYVTTELVLDALVPGCRVALAPEADLAAASRQTSLCHLRLRMTD